MKSTVRNIRFRWIVIFFFLVLLTGCSDDYNTSVVAGKYKITENWYLEDSFVEKHEYTLEIVDSLQTKDTILLSNLSGFEELRPHAVYNGSAMNIPTQNIGKFSDYDKQPGFIYGSGKITGPTIMLVYYLTVYKNNKYVVYTVISTGIKE